MNYPLLGEQQNELLCCASYNSLLDDLNTHITLDNDDLVTPPLKKQRMTDAHHRHCPHLLQQDSLEQSQCQEQQYQQHQLENQIQPIRGMSFTALDDLSMELKNPWSTSTSASDTGPSIASRISIESTSSIAHHQDCAELYPSTSTTATKQSQKRDLVTIMEGFPLAFLAKTNGSKTKNATANTNPNTNKDESSKNGDTIADTSACTSNGVDFVVKKAPSLKYFRRKWEWLAQQKGHSSELQLSDSERRQLFCECFAREITRQKNAQIFYSSVLSC
mmetsp:Transcript_3774/g.8132  ORF Transcript_3774/g.8132 Transcript_3774/m.8132 type:complete len:276 (-) Transcript_3774:1356-2183(-)